MKNDSVLISKDEWIKKNVNNMLFRDGFDVLWAEYEQLTETMLKITGAISASPMEYEQIIGILNNPLYAIDSTKQEQLDKAIELLEACSQAFFMAGNDFEIEDRVDDFLKECRSKPECKHGELMEGCCNACADSGKDPRGHYVGLDRAKNV